MARSSTLSSKGQITVPLEIRNRLGLKQGVRVEFVVDGSRTTIRPARGPEIHKYVGALPVFSGADKNKGMVAHPVPRLNTSVPLSPSFHDSERD